MKNIILILVAFCSLISCNKDDDNCVEYSEGGFTNVNGPTTVIGTVNVDIIIEVGFSVGNSCSDFNKFIKNVNGNTTTINVQVKHNVCSGCTTSAETITVDYIFNTGTPGDYVLKFKYSSSNNDDPEFFIVNILIE